MSARWRLYAVLALAGLGAAWFFSTFERREVSERVPPSGEARMREFLAAERFAERMGLASREVRSLSELDKPMPGILLVPRRHQAIDSARAARLLAWAQAGNHLVVEAELPGVNDPLLDALQVKRGPPAAAPRLQVGDKLVSFARGRGMVTVAKSLAFARNPQIGADGNAELLWEVMQLTQAKHFQVFVRPQRLSLTGFLVQHALPALIVGGLLLALWLWRIAPRFGPVMPDAPPSRRRLLDHLRASGRYYWAQDLRGRLVASARDAALRRMARSQPDFPGASRMEKEQRLAALVGIRPEEAAQFMESSGALRGADFIRTVQRAQRVHRALEKGEK